MLNVTLYAGLAGLIFVALSVRTLLLRRRLRVAIGTGDDLVLLRASRVHGNFAEYVPIALILLYLLETQAGFGVLIHVLGCVLIVGRIVHAVGVSQVDENFKLRVLGMALTFAVIIGASVRLILAYIAG